MPEEKDGDHQDKVYKGDFSELELYKIPSEGSPKPEDLIPNIEEIQIESSEERHQVDTANLTGGSQYKDEMGDLSLEEGPSDVEIKEDLSSKEARIRQILLKEGYFKKAKKGPQEVLEVGDKFEVLSGQRYAAIPYAGGTILASPDADNTISLVGRGIGNLRIKPALSYQSDGRRVDYPPQMNWYPGAGESYPKLGPDNSGIDYSDCGVTIIKGEGGKLDFQSGKRPNWPKVSQKLDQVISLIGLNSPSGK